MGKLSRETPPPREGEPMGACMDGEELEGILAYHVDDFIWGGRENFKQTVAQQI